MSGLVLVSHRDGSPVDRSVVERMLEAIAHRGPDGVGSSVRGAVGLGCQHFWTTPEEVGRRQPVSRRGTAVSVLFDGRLDNRREFRAALEQPADTPDAALVLEGFLRWGESLFERLVGPFAVIVHDRFRRRTIAARDPLGGRSIVYHADGQLLAFASEEAALLAHPAISDQLDETSVARHFALAPPEPGATFYREIREVPAGSMLRFEDDDPVRRTFWSPPATTLRYRRYGDYAEHLRELLDKSVACRMRSVSPPAVLMSGGLDSTSIAALAAQRLGRSGKGERLPVVSWIFDELAACDERRYMDAMVRLYDLRSLRIRGDDAWPLREGVAAAAMSDNSPLANPYRELLDRAYAATCLDGRRVLLTGWYGDLLYSGTGGWWAELVRDLRLREACKDLLRARRSRSGRLLRPVRAALSRWLRLGRPAPAARLDRQPWLTARSRALLHAHRKAPGVAGGLVNGSHQWYGREESSRAARCRVDVRNPYWDRRLVEFALSVPRYVLFRPGREKLVLREAMAADLPSELLRRSSHGSLAPLFRRGVVEREAGRMEAILEGPRASWGRFVEPRWLWQRRHGPEGLATDSADAVVGWSCLAWELWRKPLSAGVEPLEVAR